MDQGRLQDTQDRDTRMDQERLQDIQGWDTKRDLGRLQDTQGWDSKGSSRAPISSCAAMPEGRQKQSKASDLTTKH